VGDLQVSGNKQFKIDHPLDPENKYLTHFSVEAPEAKNVYDGVSTLDEGGEAVVELPSGSKPYTPISATSSPPSVLQPRTFTLPKR
jgi:hypothetical protein